MVYQSLRASLEVEDNYVSKYLENDEHDVYIGIGSDPTNTLPNAQKFNKGEGSTFEYDGPRTARFQQAGRWLAPALRDEQNLGPSGIEALLKITGQPSLSDLQRTLADGQRQAAQVIDEALVKMGADIEGQTAGDTG